jgi:hypothetical protein
MQQRRLRLGDILDDYCPRERRLTNHAVVAMVEDEVKQTRCTTCDADHEYKQGKMPTLRRKKDVVSAAYKEVLAAVTGEPAVQAQSAAPPSAAPSPRDDGHAPAGREETPEPAAAVAVAPLEAESAEAADDRKVPDDETREQRDVAGAEAARVHRRLIRATLPRLENHVPERPVPEFTMRQANDRGGRFRGMGSRPGGGGRGGSLSGGHPGGHARGPAFGKPPGSRGAGQGVRAGGRHDQHRPPRGGQPGKHGKKHSK